MFADPLSPGAAIIVKYCDTNFSANLIVIVFTEDFFVTKYIHNKCLSKIQNSTTRLPWKLSFQGFNSQTTAADLIFDLATGMRI